MIRRAFFLIVSCCFLSACAAEWPGKVPVDVVESALHHEASPDSYTVTDERCNPDQTMSNTLFSFSDQRHGITFDVPYNIDWVDRKGAPLSPIEFEPDAVHFGARRWVYEEETKLCRPVRDISFQTLQRRSIDAARKYYQSEYDVPSTNFAEERIGGYPVLVVRDITSDCIFTAIEVVGPLENILFTLSCAAEGKTPDSAESLRKVIRSMKIDDLLSFGWQE